MFQTGQEIGLRRKKEALRLCACVRVCVCLAAVTVGILAAPREESLLCVCSNLENSSL
jgi:hypothetical protein